MGRGEHPLIPVLVPVLVQVAAPAFAPPLDRPLSYSISETRTIGADVRRFTVQRRVTFRRRDAGAIIALVETLAVDGEAPDRTGRMFEATTRATLGRRLEVVFDAGGRAVDVLDHATHWTAQVDGIERALRAPASDPARAETLARLMAPLRTAPAAMQVQRLAGAVTALLDPALVAGGPRASRAITVPTRGHDGTAASLTGTEAVHREPDGVLRLERRTAGTLPGDAATTVELTRRVSAGGLVLHALETIRTRQGNAEQITVRETRIISPVS